MNLEKGIKMKEKKKFRLIGVYDYTVILTLLSLVAAVIGMTRAMQDYFRWALFMLALCGLLDTFDGKVARTKKNRTDDEKMYGIQLDSLVDVISFGIFPVMLCYLMGMRTSLDIALLAVYAICGVTRLAFFNVLETNRQMNPTGEEKLFHGLPITSISVILPLTFLISFLITRIDFIVILRVVMAVTAFLFVFDFKMKKPKNWHIAALILIVGIASVAILFFSQYKLPKDVEPEKPLSEVEEIQDILDVDELQDILDID